MRKQAPIWLLAMISIVACCCVVAVALPYAVPALDTACGKAPLPPDGKALSANPPLSPMPENDVEASGTADSEGGPAIGEDDSTARAPRVAKAATWNDTASYRADEAMVQLADDATPEQVSAQLADMDFVTTKEVSADDIAFGWLKLELATGTDVGEAIERLEQSGLAADAQPNFIYHVLGADDGAAATTEAGHERLDALVAAQADIETQSLTDDPYAASNEWWMKAIGLDRAWRAQPSASSVTVAVIDTGCDVGHEDFRKSTFAYCYNAATGKSGAAAVSDANGHGTHVAGIIGATADNGKGASGVAPGVKLMIVKAVDDDTSSTDVILKAYKYLIAKRKADSSIRIVNMSLGGYGGYDAALLRAMDTAYHDYGILPVLCAGNNYFNGKTVKRPYYCFPCDYSEIGLGVINVTKSAATELLGGAYSTSNYNVGAEKTKDLSAPGVQIMSTYPRALSSSDSAAYTSLTGTSMSTPIVSGVAALALSANPRLTATQLKSLLCSTAADIKRSDGGGAGFDAYTGYGLVRADRAVAGAKKSYLKGRDAVLIGRSCTLAPAQSGAWTWKSLQTSRARVSSAGVVTGVKRGEVVIRAANASTGEKCYKTIVVYDASVEGVDSLQKGSSATFGLSIQPLAMCTWTSSNPTVARVNATTGVVKALKPGCVTITATLTAAPHIKVKKKMTVTKKTNPLAIEAKTKTVAYSKVKTGKRCVGAVVSFKKKGKGAIRFAKVAGSSSSRLSINRKTGRVTVKKGTPRGTYRIRVRVRASGTSSYAARTRYVTAYVKVM